MLLVWFLTLLQLHLFFFLDEILVPSTANAIDLPFSLSESSPFIPRSLTECFAGRKKLDIDLWVLRNTCLRACVNTSLDLTVLTNYGVCVWSELFHRQLVSTRLKSNRRDTESRKGLFLLVLLSMLLWSQLNCLQNKGFYLKLTMSGLVSVQNTVDTGHEDMIVSWYLKFSLFLDK